MVVYPCEKRGKLNYPTPHAFWNMADFGAKCDKCTMINTNTIENGELKKLADIFLIGVVAAIVLYPYDTNVI